MKSKTHQFFQIARRKTGNLCKKAWKIFNQNLHLDDSSMKTACMKIAVSLVEEDIRITKEDLSSGQATVADLAFLLESKAIFLLKGFKDKASHQEARDCQEEARSLDIEHNINKPLLF